MSYALAGVSLRLMDCILVVAVSIVGPMFLVAYRPLPYCWADMLGTKALWLNPVFSLSYAERPILPENPAGFCGLCIASINIEENVFETCVEQSKLFLTRISGPSSHGQAQRRQLRKGSDGSRQRSSRGMRRPQMQDLARGVKAGKRSD